MYIPPGFIKSELAAELYPPLIYGALNYYVGRWWNGPRRDIAQLITFFEVAVFGLEFIKNPELLKEPAAYIPIVATAALQGIGYLTTLRNPQETNLESKIE